MPGKNSMSDKTAGNLAGEVHSALVPAESWKKSFRLTREQMFELREKVLSHQSNFDSLVSLLHQNQTPSFELTRKTGVRFREFSPKTLQS